MKKQVLIAGAGVLIVALLFLLGKTTTDRKNVPEISKKKVELFDIQSFIIQKRQTLSPTQINIISRLEQDFNCQKPELQIIAYNNAAAFWKDSIGSPEIYMYYIGESSKLDNSEKNLTFAAQLYLNSLRDEQNEAKLDWESSEAISLFEKAIALNPNNDDLKVGLGSCYVFGKGRNGNPQETMKGIQELLGVVRKDSLNMKAQLVLGIGGYVSGQYDKAIVRFIKVIEKEPGNVEAIVFLADTYAAQGNKAEAIKWYNISKRFVNDPDYSKEVDNRVKLLQENK